ncbi:hypothetical protein [Methanospirillum sp.]
MIRTQDIPILASLGKIRIKVRKKPVIGIISTGKELVPAESIPKPGEVREVNSHLIATFCRRQGAIPMKYGIVCVFRNLKIFLWKHQRNAMPSL